MKRAIILSSLLGGSAVYLVFAACSSGEMLRRPTGSSGAGTGAPPSSGPVPNANAQAATSGSRLRARYLTSDDGAKQFVGWLDLQMKMNCSFSPTPDGRIRCLPPSAFTVAYPAGIYADANCTQALAGVPLSSCTAGAPVLALDTTVGTGCAAQVRYRTVGSQYSGNGYLLDSTTHKCIPYPAAPSQALFPVGDVLPDSAWSVYVAATEQHD